MHNTMKDPEWKDAVYCFDNIRYALECLLPKSRELSLALTKIDEAQMWAEKGYKANS